MRTKRDPRKGGLELLAKRLMQLKRRGIHFEISISTTPDEEEIQVTVETHDHPCHGHYFVEAETKDRQRGEVSGKLHPTYLDEFITMEIECLLADEEGDDDGDD